MGDGDRIARLGLGNTRPLPKKLTKRSTFEYEKLILEIFGYFGVFELCIHMARLLGW